MNYRSERKKCLLKRFGLYDNGLNTGANDISVFTNGQGSLGNAGFFNINTPGPRATISAGQPKQLIKPLIDIKSN